jgi:hypothetical protein
MVDRTDEIGGARKPEVSWPAIQEHELDAGRAARRVTNAMKRNQTVGAVSVLRRNVKDMASS